MTVCGRAGQLPRPSCFILDFLIKFVMKLFIINYRFKEHGRSRTWVFCVSHSPPSSLSELVEGVTLNLDKVGTELESDSLP